jgi:hypothetical protein
MTVVFLGYRAKRPWRPDSTWDPGGATGVVEVCSASDCMSEPPAETLWSFNRSGCYSDAADAIASIPAGEESTHAVFAYWLVLGTTDPSQAFDQSLPPLPGGTGPEDFDVLGYDVVEIDASTMPVFGHSPLSCDYLACEIRVNRYCLVDDDATAARLVDRFNREQPEPGTYYALRVARQGSRSSPGRGAAP